MVDLTEVCLPQVHPCEEPGGEQPDEFHVDLEVHVRLAEAPHQAVARDR